MITAGRFNGKVTDYGVSASSNDNCQVFVVFDIAFPEGEHSMTWYGSLNAGKAREITIKSLLVLGFHSNSFDDLVDGKTSGAIEIGKEASLVIENEEYEGKNRWKIKWVNALNNGPKRIESGSAKAKLAALGLDGDLARIKAQSGVQDDMF